MTTVWQEDFNFLKDLFDSIIFLQKIVVIFIVVYGDLDNGRKLIIFDKMSRIEPYLYESDT
jgi:hypothetical protein